MKKFRVSVTDKNGRVLKLSLIIAFSNGIIKVNNANQVNNSINNLKQTNIMKNTKQIFTFWKDNKIAGIYQLTEDQLIEKFEEWLPSMVLQSRNYWNMPSCVRYFVTHILDSVGNNENDGAEYYAMERLLFPIREKYITEEEKRIENLTISSEENSKQ